MAGRGRVQTLRMFVVKKKINMVVGGGGGGEGGGGKGGRRVELTADNLTTFMCPVSRNSARLKHLEP